MPLGLLVLATVLFWLIFILIRYMVREIRYKGYYKTGNFRPLIYARYNGFVKKLKRKNIVSEKNPLPMELCGILAERTADLKELESVKTGAAVDRESVIGRVSEEYRDIFTYAEKVLYSDYNSTAEEYDVFYAKLKNT